MLNQTNTTKNTNLIKCLTLAASFVASLSLSAIAKASEAVDAFEQENYTQAKTLFKEHSNKAEANYYLGRIALIEKELDDAEDYLEDAVEASPDNVDYHYWFAVMSLKQASNASIFSAPGYVSDSKQHYQKALTLDPQHIDSMKGLVTLYVHVPAIAGGSIDKAHAMTDRLTKLDKLSGLLSRMSIYREEDQNTKELEVATDLAENFNGSAKAQSAAGFTFQKNKQYDKAISLFVSASQLKSDDEQDSINSALYQVGRTAVISGKFTEQGISALETYINLELSAGQPSKNWARYRLASLYNNQGDKENAKKLVSLALNETDDKSLKKRAKKMLKQLNK